MFTRDQWELVLWVEDHQDLESQRGETSTDLDAYISSFAHLSFSSVQRIAFNETSLKEGMVISNEPGYYEDGKWGIRIENLIA